ncbi:hypothetical protein B0H19DRAFT_1005107 [Mycena capillaripes]|nr:hypothetical protein B0H19DRAFT_1005107 [Mycena capillaripes]
MVDGMWNRLNGDEDGTSILENGWIRVNSANIVDEYWRDVYADIPSRLAWLAQANHIFNSLGIRSTFHEYVFVDGIQYELRLLGPLDNLPPGYVFLCPLNEIQAQLPGHFRIPACAAYWSHDPSGVERLSGEEARNGGFPDIQFRIWARGMSWNDGVYAGLRQFHEAKGFDPWSQEVAIELGYRLYQVSCEQDDLFAHLQESDTEDDYSDSDGDNDFSHSEDEEPDALQYTALNGNAESNPYESEDFLPNFREMDERYVVIPSSTISLGRTPTACDSPLASILLTDNRQKRPHPAPLQSDSHPISSQRARFLSPGPPPHEAPNLRGDSPAACASSSRVTLDDLRSSNHVLLRTAPLGELGLGDPLRDLDAAEVDAVMILSQLGARS